jgi:hypothetical protein
LAAFKRLILPNVRGIALMLVLALAACASQGQMRRHADQME